MRVLKLSVVVTALTLFAVACQRGEVHSIDDAALVNAVRGGFVTNHDTRGATARVEVHAKDGAITLTGTADTAADKQLAEAIARSTQGVKSVANQITVSESAANTQQEGISFDEQSVRAEARAGGERIGESSDDARIYNAVRRQLVAHEGTSKRAIFLDVVNGNVTLRGMVFSTEARDEAVIAAQKVEGVNAVNDRLKVNSLAP